MGGKRMGSLCEVALCNFLCTCDNAKIKNSVVSVQVGYMTCEFPFRLAQGVYIYSSEGHFSYRVQIHPWGRG